MKKTNKIGVWRNKEFGGGRIWRRKEIKEDLRGRGRSKLIVEGTIRRREIRN